ncbi:hypothetical protein CHARACLAT_028593 [Characodon lateralis]|uniref:Uncharacterized protein n=1 Tax=Characodon lateralis TaxID=208331 RepID=A0ABU7CSS3_9TELE|nr:hypothetical protein [Characodon lateralis]
MVSSGREEELICLLLWKNKKKIRWYTRPFDQTRDEKGSTPVSAAQRVAVTLYVFVTGCSEQCVTYKTVRCGDFFWQEIYRSRKNVALRGRLLCVCIESASEPDYVGTFRPCFLMKIQKFGCVSTVHLHDNCSRIL